MHLLGLGLAELLKTVGSTCPHTLFYGLSVIEFFNNSDDILNFEHIAMHCGLSRVIQLF